jgi:hypothetical protein
MQDSAEQGFALALGNIAKLIDSGKEKGYLTFGEVNDLIPHDVNSPEALDDLLATIDTQGIDVLEGQSKVASALEKELENESEAGDEVQLDLTADALEKTNDPVRIYLRAMGAIPLLTREGEVDIAKCIERGHPRPASNVGQDGEHRGKFVRGTEISPDPPKAKEFYLKLFQWQLERPHPFLYCCDSRSTSGASMRLRWQHCVAGASEPKRCCTATRATLLNSGGLVCSPL